SRHARDLRDRVGVLETFKSLDHQNQNDIVVDGVAIAARNSAPHSGLECLPAAVAASSEWRKIGPVAGLDRFFDSIHRRHYNNESAGIQRVLNLTFVRICDAHAWNSFRGWARTPHPGYSRPVALIVLHLRPDEVVTCICHRAID